MTNKELTKYYVNEPVTRLIAAVVILLLFISYFMGGVYLMAFLTVDFAIRAFSYFPSPIAFIAMQLTHGLHLESKPIFAAPKKFAAGIGFFFSLEITILLTLGYQNTALVFGLVLMTFGFLEFAFKICAGCYVYYWFVAPFVNKRNKSEEDK